MSLSNRFETFLDHVGPNPDRRRLAGALWGPWSIDKSGGEENRKPFESASSADRRNFVGFLEENYGEKNTEFSPPLFHQMAFLQPFASWTEFIAARSQVLWVAVPIVYESDARSIRAAFAVQFPSNVKGGVVSAQTTEEYAISQMLTPEAVRASKNAALALSGWLGRRRTILRLLAAAPWAASPGRRLWCACAFDLAHWILLASIPLAVAAFHRFPGDTPDIAALFRAVVLGAAAAGLAVAVWCYSSCRKRAQKISSSPGVPDGVCIMVRPDSEVGSITGNSHQAAVAVSGLIGAIPISPGLFASRLWQRLRHAILCRRHCFWITGALQFGKNWLSLGRVEVVSVEHVAKKYEGCQRDGDADQFVYPRANRRTLIQHLRSKLRKRCSPTPVPVSTLSGAVLASAGWLRGSLRRTIFRCMFLATAAVTVFAAFTEVPDLLSDGREITGGSLNLGREITSRGGVLVFGLDGVSDPGRYRIKVLGDHSPLIMERPFSNEGIAEISIRRTDNGFWVETSSRRVSSTVGQPFSESGNRGPYSLRKVVVDLGRSFLGFDLPPKPGVINVPYQSLIQKPKPKRKP